MVNIPMQRDDAVNLMQQIMGFRTDQVVNAQTMLQICQTMLENGPTKPWFLISEDSLVNTTIGDQRIEVPANFISEVDTMPLRFRPANFPTQDEIQLRKDDYDLLSRNFSPSQILPGSQQIPQAYALEGNYFRIFPTPDQNYAIRLIYYAMAPPLVSNITNGWLQFVPYLLIGKAGKLLTAGPRDANARAVFSEMETEGTRTLFIQTELRKHANREYQMAGPVRGQGQSGMLPPGISPDEIDQGN